MGEAVCGDCVGVCDGGGLLAEGAGCCVVEVDDCCETGDEPSRVAVFDATATKGAGDGEGDASSPFGEGSAVCAASCFGFFASAPPKIEPENCCGGRCSPRFLSGVCRARRGE